MKKKAMALLGLMGAVLGMTGCAAAGANGETAGGMDITMIIVYFVVIVGAMYFIAIRPQKKQQKKQVQLLSAMEVNDVVLTSSGFYGVVIDITDDTVIVEFGNNRNCRIPMQKAAIVEVEKPSAE